MINKLLMGIIKLIIGLVSLILTPIDNLISSLLPDLADSLTAVGLFFQLVSKSLGWVISATGISNATILVIIAYYTFKLTAPLTSYMIKLAIKWYNKLKP